MSDDKYYTPTLSDFRDGLEYEMLYQGEWISRQFHVPAKTMIANGELRVKKLDREDIEELGWRYVEDLGVCTTYLLLTNGRAYELALYPEFNKVWIVDITRAEDNTVSQDTLYSGTCRNKSHLQQLMKDLGITK